MSANTPQNYRVQGQAPLDAKLIFLNLEQFNELRNNNPAYAFDFYKGMKVYFQQEEKLYIWENPFSNNYKENEKLLIENFIYPVGSVYENFDYSFKAFNLIEVPYKIENIGVWDIDDDGFTVQVDIYEDSNINPFIVSDITNLWPSAERIAFVGGNITGLKLSNQPIELFQEFTVNNWQNLTYEIWNNDDGFIQNAKIKIIMPGEVVDYTQYANEIKGNSFKEASIIHDDFEMDEKNSIYFKPVGDSFEMYVADKFGVKRKLVSSGSQPGPKGDKGDTGSVGPQGDIGLTGSQGTQGIKGDKGDKGDIGAAGPAPDTSLFVTTNTAQPITASKNFTVSQTIQGYTYTSDIIKDKVIISPKIYDDRFRKSVIIGESVLSNLEFSQVIEDAMGSHYQERRVAIGTDILKDFKGNVNYNPDHPANDSIIAFGSLLGGGFEYGTNMTLIGTGNLESNDVKQFDSVTVVGKGNHSSFITDIPNDPNRDVRPISAPHFNMHATMSGVIMVGHENWSKDISNSVLISNHTKLFKYVFASIVIGSENQNYNQDTVTYLDNDILIGNCLNRAHPRYKPSHNLIIGSQNGYGTYSSFNPDYRPLVEGYMKENDDPYFRINGRLELKNTNLNEITKHSENLTDPVNSGGWTGNQEEGFSANNLNGTLTSNFIPEVGKSYYLKARPRNGNWTNGDWRITFAQFTDINGAGNPDFTVEQLIIPTPGNVTPVTIQAINGTGTIDVELFEVYIDSEVDPILEITGSDDIPVIEIRSGKSENNSLMIGKKSGSKQVSIRNTIAIGNNSLQNANVGGESVIIGVNAMQNSTGTGNNVAIGFEALKNTNTPGNTSVGCKALTKAILAEANSAFGFLSLENLETGLNNIAVGFFSGQGFKNGNNNTFLGTQSALILENGERNVYVGARNESSSSNVNNEIVIGSASTSLGINVGKGSNTAKIGNDAITQTHIYGDLYKNDVKMFDYITQAQYDALSPAQQNNGTHYFIQA